MAATARATENGDSRGDILGRSPARAWGEDFLNGACAGPRLREDSNHLAHDTHSRPTTRSRDTDLFLVRFQ